jgi:hydrogenase maturation protease
MSAVSHDEAQSAGGNGLSLGPRGPSLVLVGLGSPHGDDQVGWLAVDRARSRLPADVSVYKVGGGIELVNLLEGYEEAIVVDAAEPAGQPGRLRFFDWPCPDLAELRPLSTHGLGLAEAIQLAETLQVVPSRVHIVTLEAQAAEPGTPLSETAARALSAVVDAIVAFVNRRAEGRAIWCDGMAIALYQEGAEMHATRPVASEPVFEHLR